MGCECALQVQISILGAHAAVKTYIFASSQGHLNAPDGVVLLPLLAPHMRLLGRCWIGLLRDYTAIRTHWATKMQVVVIPVFILLSSEPLTSFLTSFIGMSICQSSDASYEERWIVEANSPRFISCLRCISQILLPI